MAPPKTTSKQATSIGEKQTIQARHGVATFVPKGHVIKIINTYGKQVVDTWAFALGDAPEDGDIHKDEEEVRDSSKRGEMGKGEVKEEKKEKEEGKKDGAEAESSSVAKKAEDTAKVVVEEGQKATERTTDAVEEAAEEATEGATKASEKVAEKLPSSAKKGWSSYLPSVRRTNNRASSTNFPKAASSKESEGEEVMAKSWSSYLPSIGGGRGGKEAADNTNSQSKGWSSYIPSGVGFSSYMPPKGALSGFAATHARDPTKSYAEQLFDFSKTPVGAAGLSAATGSGYAGSLYAAYKAYDTIAGSTSVPGMEYLSMMHTRASTLHLSPRVNDTLVSNLRAPLMTLVEDTSPGIHDTLIAACDPQRYKELGVEDWETHGSCSENLVLALNEINEKSGLKGSKAIGRDVTVNSVPAPLNLFMNIPWTQQGDVSFEAPTGKRGDYVKFRAERDLVVVMSACPQDILDINGRKPMVAHFVVESPSPEDVKKAEEKDAEAQRVLEKAKLRQEKEKGKGAPIAKATPDSPAVRKDSAAASTPKKFEARPSLADSQAPSTTSNSPKPGRKAPKKLEKRGSVAPKS
ncbi:hypothetical protein EG327_001921 [Venturia inaequalis]|uniref:DUF1989 domain-containing protein n=1 Tax=Venturia inaequalis TaxID=5025 RepID=A0A8H3Z910_VENIN|nr:hypothetical protein EG327_001921 [Venturia inaequalis]